MTNLYKNLKMTCLGLLAFAGMNSAMAQTEKAVPAGSLLNEFIHGDTTATGERNDVNTIYVLERGQVYEISSYLRLTDVPLQIKSADGEGAPAIIVTKDDGGGSYPQAIRTRGDLWLEDVYISNANGEGNQPKWGGIRSEGADATITFKDCLIEMDKASALQVRENGQTIVFDNCIVGKMGDYNRNNGNGRLIDAREFDIESIEVKNTTFYHLADRVIRNMSGGKIGSFVFDQNTGVAIQGYHGLFHLGHVGSVTITNNLFLNPKYMGNHTNVSEQTGPEEDSKNHYLFTADTIYTDTEFNISHNNFYWEQELLDWYDKFDTVSKAEVLAPIIETKMGAAADDAAWELSFEFDNPVPYINYEYLDTLFEHPTADPTPENWPMPEGVTIFNVNFDFTTTNPELVTGSTTGGQLGDLKWTGTLEGTSIFSVNENNSLNLEVFPNPASDLINIKLDVANLSNVEINVFDITGKSVLQKAIKSSNANITLNVDNLSSGMYFFNVKTDVGTATGKFSITE